MPAPKIEFVRNAVCPVCGKPTVAVIDHVGTLPVTICLVCDTRRMEAELGYSPWRLRWLRLRSYLAALTERGITGALLCLIAAMALPVCVMLYPQWETLSTIVMLLGMAAVFGVFTLYIAPILYSTPSQQDLTYYDEQADQENHEGEQTR